MSVQPDLTPQSPEEVLSTMTREGERRWMFPKLSPGFFYTRRKVVGWVLIALFFLLPILQLNSKPLMWLDLARRRFFMFGLTFYATDTWLSMLIALLLVVGVAWFTAIFGRVWCGWGCPQTVYMDFIFRPIDNLIDGNLREQKTLAAAPWDAQKLFKRGLKLVIYTVIAALMSHTFVAYFVSWEHLLGWMTHNPREHWGFFVLMGLTTGLVVFDFFYFREQMCTIICPYARLQSVLLDRDSLIVSYDPGRGEPRAGGRERKKMQAAAEQSITLQVGDCIDCGACVRTCPTGIDIRQGLQMECINCTQCIDACDPIMIGMGKPTGLIRYSSENQLEGKPGRLLRARVLFYSALLLGLSVLLVVGVMGSAGLEVEVVRASGAPFAMMPDGHVSNAVSVRVHNRTPEPASLTLSIVSPEQARLRASRDGRITLESGQMARIDAWILLPAGQFDARGSKAVVLKVSDGDQLSQLLTFPALGPSAR